MRDAARRDFGCIGARSVFFMSVLFLLLYQRTIKTTRDGFPPGQAVIFFVCFDSRLELLHVAGRHFMIICDSACYLFVAWLRIPMTAARSRE